MSKMLALQDDFERNIWCIAFANEQHRWGVNISEESSDMNIRMANAAVEAYRRARDSQ